MVDVKIHTVENGEIVPKMVDAEGNMRDLNVVEKDEELFEKANEKLEELEYELKMLEIKVKELKLFKDELRARIWHNQKLMRKEVEIQKILGEDD